MFTLIKPEGSIPNKEQSFLGGLKPLGSAVEVSKKLLDIPNVEISFFNPIDDGKITLLWNIGRIMIDYKEEPEFGSQDVFIINLDKVLLNKPFYVFYSQIHEYFGCTLLYKKVFLSISDFKKFV